MTSVDDMASEIMKGLQEYADLADTEMKKAVRKTATEVKKEISSNAPKDTGASGTGGNRQAYLPGVP